MDRLRDLLCTTIIPSPYLSTQFDLSHLHVGTPAKSESRPISVITRSFQWTEAQLTIVETIWNPITNCITTLIAGLIPYTNAHAWRISFYSTHSPRCLYMSFKVVYNTSVRAYLNVTNVNRM